VIVCFVDIGGIVDHHCLEVIVFFFILVQQNKQSPLNSDGQQFNQYQQNKQSPPNSDGQQFHQYQKNKQSPPNRLFALLILMELLTITV
jgi:hypothetical protein